MKSTSFSLIALALSSAVLGQNYNVSAPFELVIISKNATINGTSLVACHEGAAIEGLCATSTMGLQDAPGTHFNLNTTDNGLPPNITIGTPGILTYELVGSNFAVSEPMALSYTATTNIALPLFSPGYETTEVAFDECGLMNIQGYVDDTVDPAKYQTQAYYRWYICLTTTSYTYQTLSWRVGRGRPENPTCQKVEVKQVFV